MTNDTGLLKRREELKHRLVTGEYRTLVDAILDWTGRAIQKIGRNRRSISVWYSAMVIFLITFLVGLTPIVLLGESSTLSDLSRFFPIDILPIWFVAGCFTVASMVVTNTFVHHIFTTLRENVLDSVESTATLDDIERWLSDVCNKRNHLIAGIAVGVLAGLYVTLVVSARVGYFPGFGITLLNIILSIQSAVFIILLFFILALSARIHRYELKLYTADPSSSEVISRLSGTLNSFVYLVAAYAAIVTLSAAWFGLLASAGILGVPIFWTPIIVMFVTNQYGLASIIRRAKWRTLNEIQAKVEKLQTEENLTEKDTMEAINGSWITMTGLKPRTTPLWIFAQA